MSNNPSNIVYLIGAGASRALSPADRIPDMSNFFDQAARLLLKTCNGNADKKELVKFFGPLATMERYRVFTNRNPELEDIAARGIDDKGLPIVNLAKRYAQKFLKDSQRCSENLEEVFLKAEIEGENSAPYEGLGCLLQAVFVRLADAVDREDTNPYRLLARLHSERRVQGTFINFNYDVWLEQALQEEGVFNVFGGYGGFLSRYLTEDDYRKMAELPPADRANWVPKANSKQMDKGTATTCCVLKPHGSLSWIHRYKEVNEVFVLTSNDGKRPVCSWSAIGFGGIDGHSNTYIQPLVVSPGKAKRRAGGLFWKIDKSIVNALTMAHVLVVIGYRLPETDQEMAELFSFATMRRLSSSGVQPQRLLICTMGKPDRPYETEMLKNRLAVIFRPEYPPSCHDAGFSKTFVDKLNNSKWTDVG